jgi:hypothetical protein
VDSPRERDSRDCLPPFGCLKGEAQLSALKGFECNPILRELADGIRRGLRARRIPMTELTLCIEPEIDLGAVATAKMEGPEGAIQIGEELPEPTERARMVLNLRGEGKPDHLHAAVTHALTEMCAAFPSLFVRIVQLESFRPRF